MSTFWKMGICVRLHVLLGLGLVTASSNAGEMGEYFVDIYGGYAATQGDTIHGEYQNVSIFGSSAPVGFKSSYGRAESSIYGGRFGLWLEPVPWLGFALDGSYFDVEPTDDNLDINVFSLSPLVMARYPLMVSEDHPNGRLQPYLAAGLALAWVDTSFTYDDGPDQTEFSDVADGIGPDLRLGNTIMLSRKIGMFVEYRYTYLRVKSNKEDDWVFLGGQITGMKTTLSTQYVLGGITFRF